MNGTDFLQLDATTVPRGHRASWLTDAIRKAIADGHLSSGMRLPATRALSQDLGIARGTVTEAFQRLTEEGLIVPNRGGGTVVAASVAVAEPPAREDDEHPHVVDLSTGLPDLTAFPRTAWLRAEREVLSRSTDKELGYADSQGAPELRYQLAKWLGRSRGVSVDPKQIVVTSGVTQALSLLAQVLRDRSSDRGTPTLAVEDPGAEGNRRLLGYWIDRVVPVPVDEHGLVVSELARIDPTAVMTTPAHQFPTGVALSPERRRELVAWAANGGLIIEDDYDAEYRYDRAPIRALHGLAPHSIAYTASLSKTLAPALRLGWLVAPPDLHDAVVTKKWATDLGSPVLPQLALAHLIRTGTLEKHLRTMRTRHRQRRDAAARAVARYLPDCTVEGIAAGLHILIGLPERFDDEDIARRAAERGIKIHPLSLHRATPGSPGLVIGYGAHPPERIDHAIRLLGQIITGSRQDR
ncbi:PLP-dependent aminotransferase family protein [Amycolatopsis anabasis]|uniref:MocR-like pyridoxine biosynthesis transcription factor PdxR n=1 Tax=Amycolatopsis anabasis TaxID=1840409 RepID=UPI00131C7F77|nr:PLP-dependent aminotransferase family protein [Amycolatopsis anabasis]